MGAYLYLINKSSILFFRRSTASILASICAKSRKPENFSFWLFKTIIGSVVPCTGDPQSIPADKARTYELKDCTDKETFSSDTYPFFF